MVRNSSNHMLIGFGMGGLWWGDQREDGDIGLSDNSLELYSIP